LQKTAVCRIPAFGLDSEKTKKQPFAKFFQPFGLDSKKDEITKKQPFAKFQPFATKLSHIHHFPHLRGSPRTFKSYVTPWRPIGNVRKRAGLLTGKTASVVFLPIELLLHQTVKESPTIVILEFTIRTFGLCTTQPPTNIEIVLEIQHL
jgi:hypothetical protein